MLLDVEQSLCIKMVHLPSHVSLKGTYWLQQTFENSKYIEFSLQIYHCFYFHVVSSLTG